MTRSADDIATAAEAAEAEVLSYLAEVHTDPDRAPVEVPERLAKGRDRKSAARWAYERLILYIQNFEAQLDADQEIAMGFVGAEAGVLRIEGIGYFDPDLVTFYGTDENGLTTQLVQHVTQLSVLLRALPRADRSETPVRIGFRLAKALEAEPPDATS